MTSLTPVRKNARMWTVLLVALLAAASGVAAQAGGSGGEDRNHADSQGYVRVQHVAGVLDCAVGAMVVATGECLSKAPEIQKTFLPEGTNTVVLELRWVPNHMGASTLAISAPGSLDEDAKDRTWSGKSILRAEILSSSASGIPAEETLIIEIKAAPDSGLVLQQNYQLATSAFVGMDMPAGYSAFSKPVGPDPGTGGKETSPPKDHKHKEKPGQVSTYQVGFLRCGSDALGSAADGVCPPAKLAAGLPAGTTVQLIEVRWTPTSQLGAGALAIEHAASLDGSGWKVTEGKSPIRIVIEGGPTAEKSASAIVVRAGEGSALVLDQKFEVAFTAFIGEEVPEGFTALP